jgi:cell division protein FtsI (penicillin-binding protein 3)
VIELPSKRHYLPKAAFSPNLRYYSILAILFIAMLALIWRLVDLTVIDRAFLQGQGDARTLRTISLPSYRGMILDRNGQSLAVSTPVDTVWANPKEFSATSTDLTKLATLLNIPKSTLHAHLLKARQKDFIYLKRGIDPDVGATIKTLGIPGIYLQREYRRYYPEGEVTAHILGFTNVDDHGQEGLELAYDQWLQGAPGLKRVLQDRYGHIVQDVDTIRSPRAGQNLVLSIDRRIQYFAYRELADGITKYKAVSGSVVVLDAKTGEILAMANWPSYNPNNRPCGSSDCYRNRAETDTFEPGSSMKPFSMASALTSGKYTPDSKIDTAPGYIYIDGKKNQKVTDDEHNEGVLDLSGILRLSSNVGMSKITISLPPEDLWNMLHNVGFGQSTESGFPGERSGLLPNYPVWNSFVLATMSFGYGLSVTPLQLAQAYATLASDGVKRPVTFIKTDTAPAGTQIIQPQIAKELLVMLESVLYGEKGTAPLARVPGYRVTGKTGTAHIVGPQGYEKHHYNSIFVGIAPASNPRLVIAVVLHDPQGTQYYGGYTSGPIFSHIMGESLRLLNVPPDDINSNTTTTTASNNAAENPPPTGMAD